MLADDDFDVAEFVNCSQSICSNKRQGSTVSKNSYFSAVGGRPPQTNIPSSKAEFTTAYAVTRVAS